MKRKTLVVISVMLILALLPACRASLPENKLPALADPKEVVYFGMYDQGGADPEPIHWEVLGSSGGRLVMISERILEAATFDDSSQPYGSSDIKAWLNDGFYNAAFTDAEKAVLSGNEGSKVRLLTLEEAQNASYYPDDA